MYYLVAPGSQLLVRWLGLLPSLPYGQMGSSCIQGSDGHRSKVSFFSLLFVYLLVVYIYNVFASYFTVNNSKLTFFNVFMR